LQSIERSNLGKHYLLRLGRFNLSVNFSDNLTTFYNQWRLLAKPTFLGALNDRNFAPKYELIFQIIS